MYPTQIGISTNVFDDPAEVAALVRRLSKSFSIIEIEIERAARRLFDERTDLWLTQRRELIDLREEHGLTYSLHTPYLGPRTDLANRSETIRLASVCYLSRYIDEAYLLGLSAMTIHPGFVACDARGITGFSFEQLARSLETLQHRATGLGVQLLVKSTRPDEPSYLALSDDQERILCQGIGVAMTLDIADFRSFRVECGDFYYRDKIERVMANVRNVRFSDRHHAHAGHRLPCPKNFLYADLVSLLRRLGYHGDLIMGQDGADTGFARYRRRTRHTSNALPSG